MSAMGAIGAIGAIGAEKNSACRYLADGFSIRPGEGQEELFGQAKKRMKRAGVDTRSLHFRLFKRSVDARRRDDIRLICTVLVESDEPLSARVCARAGLKQLADGKPVLHVGTEPMERPPLVVGMGPAGLFAALLLAQNGYRPVIIDRGDAVSERVAKVELFRTSGELDGESNVQFGAGGAGTFSDGKLVTRIHDPRCRFVLETFHRFGAPDEILTLAKPHIGTDILRTVVARMLAEIERLGGEVRYRCRAESLRENADGSVTVRTPQGEEAFSAVVLAVGHSARDTYEELIAGGFAVEAKPISVGVRAEHLQADIDRALYGDFAGHPDLGHAEYALSDTRRARGVYTFCMCPGGEVVAAASEDGGLVVNGMSNHARDGKNANAAVLVSVGCGDWYAPMMTIGDFLGGGCGSFPADVQPTYRGGKVRPADFGEIFPPYILESLRYALHSFAGRIPGYDKGTAVLTAAETRTSAPVRILRDADRLSALGHDRIYPCGEGAGYAGGITSAAVDGIRVAESLISRFRPGE